MKISIFTIILLSSLISNAAQVFGICMTSIAPSTTFELKSNSNHVNFEITNHNGGQYAPFWHSIVVPNDLSLLGEKAETILKLDRGFKASFPVESCTWTSENKFACLNYDQKLSVNGVLLQPWALYSSVITDSSFAGDFKYTEMTVLFQADGKEYNYTMRYADDECLLSEKPIDGQKLKKLKNNKGK